MAQQGLRTSESTRLPPMCSGSIPVEFVGFHLAHRSVAVGTRENIRRDIPYLRTPCIILYLSFSQGNVTYTNFKRTAAYDVLWDNMSIFFTFLSFLFT